jgi:hypothetical protein
MKAKKINAKVVTGSAGTSLGSAAFYVNANLEFSGEGIYEDDDFVIIIEKAGKLAAPPSKQSKTGEEQKIDPSVNDYYGQQFHGRWFHKNRITTDPKIYAYPYWKTK